MTKEKEKIFELLRRSLEFIKDYLEVDGGCDHSVGICNCNEYDLVEKIEIILKERKSNSHKP